MGNPLLKIPLCAVALSCALTDGAEAGVLYSYPGSSLVSDNSAFPLPGLGLSRGAAATGVLYFKYIVTNPASNAATESYYAGLSFYDGGSEHLGVGNGWGPWAYSAFGPNGNVDFNSATSEPGEVYQHVRATDVTTIVIRVNFKSGADDDITVWLDPDFNLAENEQNPALVTNFTANADFDTICLREGGENRNGWSFSDIVIAENATDPGFSRSPDRSSRGTSSARKASRIPTGRWPDAVAASTGTTTIPRRTTPSSVTPEPARTWMRSSVPRWQLEPRRSR